MISNLRGLDLGQGMITFVDDELRLDRSLAEQVEILREDLLQVEFGRYLLDVGWRPSFDASGSFHVRIVMDLDWETPKFQSRPRTSAGLIKSVSRAMAQIQSLNALM